MNSKEFFNKLLAVSDKILSQSRKTILLYLRFMDMAISKLDYVPVTDGSLDTITVDGEHVYYNPEYVVEQYKEAPERVIRDILHMVMHCVFRHNFSNGRVVNTKYWDVACDIAVENAINELALDKANDGSYRRQSSTIVDFMNRVSFISAEQIYNYFISIELNDADLAEYASKFVRDNHESWYSPATRKELQDIANGKNPNSQDKPEDSDSDKDSNEDSDSDNDSNEDSDNNENSNEDSDRDSYEQSAASAKLDQLSEDWKFIGDRMQTDLQTFNKDFGDKAGSLTQNIREVNRERYDYTEFLREFATTCEVMKINDDEFDYIYYTYGMEEYGDMPLVEPLEYKDEKRINDFAIAIDTSGSTSGELVQRFVNKTYNILKQEESFTKTFNLHIIQCDTEIQYDMVIHNEEELEEYVHNMKIYGQGGTNFVPVFDYVDKLIEDKKFTDFKGLIFFTDGCGQFPDSNYVPDYKVAFVFIEDGFNNYDVPPWAIKLILDGDEF